MPEIPAMLPFEEAQATVLERMSALPPEWVPLADALGRTLAVGVEARRTLPPWPNSAMDGFAVRAADAGQVPIRLRIVGAAFAGARVALPIGPGEAVRIATGAPLPPGADAVVMVERTRAHGEWVELLAAASAGQFVRPAGEDARAGEPLLGAGTPLGIPEASLLWAQGMSEVFVPRAPKVAILSSGDELGRLHEAQGDRIVDTNSLALCAAVRRAGGTPTLLGIAGDDRDQLRALFERAAGHDVVLSSAGASVGERDFVQPVLRELGVQLHFWKAAIKPGKPILFGTRGPVAFFGLPGNPASSLVTFELFVRPGLRRLQGHAQALPTPVYARAATALHKPAGLTHFLRVTASAREGALWATPVASQNSGALRSTTAATHLLEFPATSTHLEAGEPARLLPVSWVA
jgi:molybdopterin molybdotransferase